MNKKEYRYRYSIIAILALLTAISMQSCGRKYDYVGEPQRGLALVHSVKSEKYGAINYKKEEVIPCIYDTILLDNKLPIVMQSGKYGAVSGTGTEVIPCQYDAILLDRELPIVIINGKSGVFTAGREIIPTNYDTVYFSNDKITAKLNEEYFDFNKEGEPLLPELRIEVDQDGTQLSSAERQLVRFLPKALSDLNWSVAVHFLDVNSREQLVYKILIVNDDTVIDVKSDLLFEDEPSVRFVFKNGKTMTRKVNYNTTYPYTYDAENRVLNIKNIN